LEIEMADVVEIAIQDISRMIKEIRQAPSISTSTQDGDHFSISFKRATPESKPEPNVAAARNDRSA
jgi:hypothetical protein